MRYVLTRRATRARTDEDAAMAHVNYGVVTSVEEARNVLRRALHDEADQLEHAYGDDTCARDRARRFMRLAAEVNALLDVVYASVETDGLRFGWHRLPD